MKTYILLLILIFSLPGIAICQPDKTPYHHYPYEVFSGVYDGPADPGAVHTNPFTYILRVDNSSWLRVHFGDCNLGKNSYIEITSLEDEGTQKLNSTNLSHWHNGSTFFNGEAVRVDLFVAPEDTDIYLEIMELIAGEYVSGGTRSICGLTDNRVFSYDDAVAREIYISGSDSLGWCTAFIVSNGAHLAAGHCYDGMSFIEFEVPQSDPDGTLNFSDPDNHYVVKAGFDYHNNGLGDDWLVFNVYANSNTGLMPYQAQNDFYRMTKDYSPTTLRITGCGKDNDPIGSTGGNNYQTKVQQTHTGPNLGEVYIGASEVYWKYEVDTWNAGSGSPVIYYGTNYTIGIHTSGGCTSGGGYNKGVSFENNSLESALQTFPGSNVKYVDKGHTLGGDAGTIFRPYSTVTQGVSGVTTGGILSIVKGTYNESGTLTIEKAMTIEAPVGTVTIY